MRYLYITSIILLIIGGINWGLVGLFDFNLVSAIFGHFPLLVKLIYSLVGLAALFVIFKFRCLCDKCHDHEVS